MCAVRLPLLLVFLALSAACHRDRPPSTVVAAQASPWTAWPGLMDVVCYPGEIRCVALDGAGLAEFFLGSEATPVRLGTNVAGADGLVLLDGVPAITLPCADMGRCAQSLSPASASPQALPMVEPNPAPSSDLDQDGQAAMFARQFSPAAKSGGRVGFYRLVVARDGGRVALMPGNGGTLLHTGRGIQVVRLGLQDVAQPWPATLALHPSGQELYVVAWPDGTVRALDPLTLAPHWTLPMGAPAFGLYIDPSGRYLLGQLASLEEGDEDISTSLNRMDFWAEPDGSVDDEALRSRELPPAKATFVVDLAARTVAAALPGRLRRSLLVGDGLLIATSDALQFVKTLPVDPDAAPSPTGVFP